MKPSDTPSLGSMPYSFDIRESSSNGFPYCEVRGIITGFSEGIHGRPAMSVAEMANKYVGKNPQYFRVNLSR